MCPKMGAPTDVVPVGRGRYGGVNLLTIPDAYSVSDATLGLTLNRIYYWPIIITTPKTINQVTYEVTIAAGAGNRLRFGIYLADINWQPGALVVVSAELAIDGVAVVNGALAVTGLPPNRYLMALTCQANVTFRSFNFSKPLWGLDPNLGANPFVNDVYVVAAYAALPNPGTPWTNVDLGSQGVSYVNVLNELVP